MSTCLLQDAFGGMLGINIDMLSETTLTLTNPAFANLILKVTPLPESMQTRGVLVDIDGDNVVTVSYDDEWIGSETVIFTATDQTDDMLSDSDAATFTVTEVPNTAPVADDQDVSLDEDGSLAITLTATDAEDDQLTYTCLLYTSPSPRDATLSRMPSSA